jgi:uncharacterized protein (DUF305 family)
MQMNPSDGVNSSRALILHRLQALTGCALLAAAVLANGQGMAMPDNTKPSAKSASTMDMGKSMSAMMKDMQGMTMTGDTDRDFATMMRMHHQGALDMAQAELDSGKDPQLKSMAKKIIASQQKEIKEFDQWLAKHGTAAFPTANPK